MSIIFYVKNVMRLSWIIQVDPNAFISVLIRESERNQSQTHRRGGNVSLKSEIGVMGLQVKE